MKYFLRCLLGGMLMCMLYSPSAKAQAIKTNLPLILAGSPNIGTEWFIGKQFSVNGDVLWTPYLFKKNEEVFRSLIGSVDFRYYINPKYYYANDLWDGLYVGPYAMAGNFNIGLKNKNSDLPQDSDLPQGSFRRKGWGVSAGVSAGYKFYISDRFRMDINLGLGYAHLQYDKYDLGAQYAEYPLERKKTKSYWGPTKFGVHLVYNIFR